MAREPRGGELDDLVGDLAVVVAADEEEVRSSSSAAGRRQVAVPLIAWAA